MSFKERCPLTHLVSDYNVQLLLMYQYYLLEFVSNVDISGSDVILTLMKFFSSFMDSDILLCPDNAGEILLKNGKIVCKLPELVELRNKKSKF